MPKEQKGGGDRDIISKLTGLIPGFSGGEVKTPTEDYNYQVRNKSDSDWIEVVENVSEWSVSN